MIEASEKVAQSVRFVGSHAAYYAIDADEV
jgi:hypothetical protein